MRTVLIALLAVALFPPIAHARLFHAFDFEERQLGNDEDIPMHWAKVAAVDLPHYVVGQLTTDRARGGRYSFRMDLNGGSCVYQYDSSRLPAAVGGHYRFGGYCCTSPLAHARARLSVAVLDADGHVLTEATSDPYAGDDWHPLSAEVTATDPRSATVRLRMELVQPARLGPPAAGVIPAEDVRGTAWFDDLTVAQLPRLSLSTARPCNVFRRGDEPALSVLLDDPSTEDLTAQLTVTDAGDRAVYQQTNTVTPTSGGRVAVPLPVTAAGWYRATLRVAAPGDDVVDDQAVATLDYVQLADGGEVGVEDPRFAIAAAGLPDAAWPAAADVLPLLSAGRVKVSTTGALDDRLHDLAAHGLTAVGCLPVDDVDAATNVIARHAGHVDRWQIGADDAEAFVTGPAARAAAGRVSAVAASLTSGFDLAVPCPLGFDPPPVRAVALWVPSSVLASEIGPYLADRAKGPRVTSVSLQPLDGGRYGPAARASDLAIRIVSAVAAGADRVDVPVPLAAAPASPLVDAGRSAVEPTDLFLVERAVLSAVAGAACHGRVPLADGVDAVAFERPDGTGVAVLWADRPTVVNLGGHLTRTDLWGNTSPVPAGGVVAGPVPAIVTGLDVPLARFRAGVSVDRPALESVLLKSQVRRLHVANPYGTGISGTLRLRGPAGWTLTPAVVPFSLAAGESADRDVGFDLPVNVRTGANRITVDADYQVDGGAAVRASVPIDLSVGLSDVGVQSTAFRDGAGVVVQQRITNYGTRPVDYVAYAACPGQPRVERFVTALAPGRSTLKRYRFNAPAGGEAVTVRSGVHQLDGPRVLNEVLTVR